MFGQRILIAVPHPDDEIVACGAAIGRARAAGAEIFALYLTHGCIAREVRWPWDRTHHDTRVAVRHAEAEDAAKFLRIAPAGWSERPARHLWRELPQVYSELKTVIDQYRIDQLWVPAYEGGNADHDGLNAVGSLFVDGFGKNKISSSPLEGEVGWGVDSTKTNTDFSGEHPPSNSPLKGRGIPFVLEFAEYNFFGGTVRSQEFPYPNGTEQILTLNAEERAKKIAALKIYASEKGNLNYVKPDRECFRPLAAYDYTQPPHPGTLWYARFQWVPFRHPRVDFASPKDVSNETVNFLKNMT